MWVLYTLQAQTSSFKFLFKYQSIYEIKRSENLFRIFRIRNDSM